MKVTSALIVIVGLTTLSAAEASRAPANFGVRPAVKALAHSLPRYTGPALRAGRVDPAATLGFRVVPANFDPYGTNATQTFWQKAQGCPTNAAEAYYVNGQIQSGSYTDPTCTTGDPKDYGNNWGLEMVKTGPTNNYAAAQVYYSKPTMAAPLTVTELGYDLRSGSHCGAAPYYVLTDTNGGTTFVACYQMTATATSTGWKRMRYTYSNQYQITSIYLLLDEGQDLTSDQFGSETAGSGKDTFDNFDLNGTLRGRP